MKTHKIITVIILTLTLNSCNTTPREKIWRFYVNINSQQLPIGEVEFQIDRPFPLGGIKKVTAEVSYFPHEDAVCINYKTAFFTYHQFWSSSGRTAFINSLDIYIKDYTDKNLNPSDRKSKNIYGTIEGYVYWQQFSFTKQFNANMDIELGYYFREGSPFFSITQLEAFFTSPTLDPANNSNSPEIPIFFTRSQADELAALFDQDFLQSVSPIRQRQAPAGVVAPDSY
jgi:hypothetical protein